MRVIADEIGDGEKEIRPDLRLIEDLGLDSLDAISLAIALEEEFSIEIPDDDLETLLTVKDVCDYVERHAKVSV